MDDGDALLPCDMPDDGRKALDVVRVHDVGPDSIQNLAEPLPGVTVPGIVVDVLREHRRQQLEQRVALGLGKLDDDAVVFPAAESDGPARPSNLSGIGRQWPRASASPASPSMRCGTLMLPC